MEIREEEKAEERSQAGRGDISRWPAIRGLGNSVADHQECLGEGGAYRGRKEPRAMRNGQRNSLEALILLTLRESILDELDESFSLRRTKWTEDDSFPAGRGEQRKCAPDEDEEAAEQVQCGDTTTHEH
uniref:Uncharacterized protein n=1 Tax=Globodera rostochiensis TaxID=31243 RepID=A0A914HV02_GLORO